MNVVNEVRQLKIFSLNNKQTHSSTDPEIEKFHLFFHHRVSYKCSAERLHLTNFFSRNFYYDLYQNDFLFLFLRNICFDIFDLDHACRINARILQIYRRKSNMIVIFPEFKTKSSLFVWKIIDKYNWAVFTLNKQKISFFTIFKRFFLREKSKI